MGSYSLGGALAKQRGKSETELRDERQRFRLDLNAIMQGMDSRTTLMIKNIPNKYTQKMLITKLNQSHKGKFDFFYLPIDFKVCVADSNVCVEQVQRWLCIHQLC